MLNNKHCPSCRCTLKEIGLTEEEEEKYRFRVIHSLINKIQEFQHYLSEIIMICDETMRLFKLGKIDLAIQKANEKNYRLVCYRFSAFSNVTLTIKDSFKTSFKKYLPKKRIEDLFRCNHLRFFLESRNAVTHDGEPIIRGNSNGLYFIGVHTIRRLDSNKKLIEIKAPTTDIRTLCLEFASNYCTHILQLLHEAIEYGYEDRAYNLNELKQDIDNVNIPSFLRSAAEFNWQEIEDKLCDFKPKTAENIIQSLNEVIEYCKAKVLN